MAGTGTLPPHVWAAICARVIAMKLPWMHLIKPLRVPTLAPPAPPDVLYAPFLALLDGHLAKATATLGGAVVPVNTQVRERE